MALANFQACVKPAYDPSESSEEWDSRVFYVNFPGAPDNAAAGMMEGLFAITAADLGELFRPQIEHVLKLVKEQKACLAVLGKTARGIILVGGFGKSHHLYKPLKLAFAEEDPNPPVYSAVVPTDPVHSAMAFEVIQPTEAWTAVVRGAVLGGLGIGKITSRKARRHYGISRSTAWDPSEHSIANRFWDELRYADRARRQLKWFIKKGDTVVSDEPIIFQFSFNSLNVGHNFKTTTVLVCCDDDISPTEHFGSSYAPAYEAARLAVDLSSVSKRCWRKKRNPVGGVYHVLDHEVAMQVRNGRTVFDLRVNGKVYGSIDVEFV